jgi:hypothetical protein
MNKKIRYAMGAVGAMPALAMIPVPFAAATAATHAVKTPASTGKKARTVYARDTAANLASASVSPTPSPGITTLNGPTACTPNFVGHATRISIRSHFSATFAFGPHGCVSAVGASLNFHQDKRLLRVRVWKSGHDFQPPLAHGSPTNIFTSNEIFSIEGINHRGSYVCAALVNQNNIKSVTNGPVCATLPS